MIDYYIFHQIAIILINILCILLGFLVYKKSARKELRGLFLIITILLLAWVNFVFFGRVIVYQNPEITLSFLRIAWFVTPLVFLFLYFFIINLVDKKQRYKRLSILFIFLGVSASLMAGFTDLVVKNIRFVGNVLALRYGNGMYPFLIAVFILMIGALLPLYWEYAHFFSREKKKNTIFFDWYFSFLFIKYYF